MLYTCKTASPEELFDFAFELVWRYEHDFASYNERFVNSLQKIFDAAQVNEADENKYDEADVESTQKFEQFGHHFFIGLFLLREYREELNTDAWSKVYKILEHEVAFFFDGCARLKLGHIKLFFMQQKIAEASSKVLQFTCDKTSYEMRIQIAEFKAEFGIPWPCDIGKIIMSEKDRDGKRLYNIRT